MKAALALDRTMELRRNKRYILSAPVRFAWASHGGSIHNGEGITRDINEFGAYVLTDNLPSVGALIDLDVLLPNREDFAPGMRLYGEGKVIRCEPNGNKDTGTREGGFAASVQFYPEPSEVALLHLERSEQIVEGISGRERTERRFSSVIQALDPTKLPLPSRFLVNRSPLIGSLHQLSAFR
jgi:hypothetical protein